MKRLLFSLILGVSALASAGELENADKFLVAKAYDKAFPIYARLAETGNVEAQFRLGEMYWYGDGTAVDIKSATAWMQKAAARGHGGAVESLAILKQRETRAADVAYWTSGYTGEDLVSGKYNCPAPVIPEISKTQAQIKEATAAYAKWRTCYNGFVADINGALAPAKRIPADVVTLLTPREAEQAANHLSSVYGRVIDKSQQDAARVIAQYSAWQGATERIVSIQNMARQQENQIRVQRMQELETQRATMYPTINPAQQPTVGGK